MEELGKNAKDYIIETPTKIKIDGVQLKHLIAEKAAGVCPHYEGGDFPDFTGYSERLANPQKGDWSFHPIVIVDVFDGKKWRKGQLFLQDLTSEDIVSLGRPEYFIELKYQFNIP